MSGAQPALVYICADSVIRDGFSRTIADVMGREVVLVSSADETAFEAKAILGRTGIGAHAGRDGTRRFISSGDVEEFRRLGRRLLGPELDVDVESRSWGS